LPTPIGAVGHFAVRDQRERRRATVVAPEIHLQAREGVAEAVVVGGRAGTARHAGLEVLGAEVHLEVGPIGETGLESWIEQHPAGVVGVRRRGVVEAVDEDVAFILEVAGIDGVGHVRLGRPVGVERPHQVLRRRVEQVVHALVRRGLVVLRRAVLGLCRAQSKTQRQHR
jgi:hypothetical protein